MPNIRSIGDGYTRSETCLSAWLFFVYIRFLIHCIASDRFSVYTNYEYITYIVFVVDYGLFFVIREFDIVNVYIYGCCQCFK